MCELGSASVMPDHQVLSLSTELAVTCAFRKCRWELQTPEIYWLSAMLSATSVLCCAKGDSTLSANGINAICACHRRPSVLDCGHGYNIKLLDWSSAHPFGQAGGCAAATNTAPQTPSDLQINAKLLPRLATPSKD